MFEVLKLNVQDMIDMEVELDVFSRGIDFQRDCPPEVATHSMNVTIIAKTGDRGDDWAAYSGWPVQCHTYASYKVAGIDMNDPDKVAAHGDKLPQALAEELFPKFVEAGLIYRR